MRGIIVFLMLASMGFAMDVQAEPAEGYWKDVTWEYTDANGHVWVFLGAGWVENGRVVCVDGEYINTSTGESRKHETEPQSVGGNAKGKYGWYHVTLTDKEGQASMIPGASYSDLAIAMESCPI